MKPSIIIAGGGIAGLSTAIALQQQGIQVTVYDAQDPNVTPGIGLGIGANAIQALDTLQLKSSFIARGQSLSSIQFISARGRKLNATKFALQDSNEAQYVSILRSELLELLRSKIEDPSTIITGKKCVDVEQNENKAILRFQDGSVAEADAVISADGIHSRIRRQLFKTARIRPAGYSCWTGVAPRVPDGFDGTFATETWGPAGRVGIVPLSDRRAYWFICINDHMNKRTIESLDGLIDHFKGYHTAILDILRASDPDQISYQPIMDLQPMPRFTKGRVALIGDAAHAATPNLGQGACQAIEDAVILAKELGRQATVEGALRRYEQLRLKRVNKITRISRMLGVVAQIENEFITSVRNIVMPMLPASFNNKQLEFIYRVDFND
ncbi:FAD-dependent oxidoreductase [Paenibacillus guangzhouensis]|uniref:FAD-dependent oxidoreductase n=1 Tax=Paenibacillus guangzhouensis TaxID=1473112 RepID=UPI001266A69A|nr:FAD-dependent oxidoreductase [Paenibacillus guangzhouensis]